MEFVYNAVSDIGVYRASNQDSLCVKSGKMNGRPILMAVVCDGMGGLADGEMASAWVTEQFSAWFDHSLAVIAAPSGMTGGGGWETKIGNIWADFLRGLNQQIREYGGRKGESLGTTFSGMLIYEGKYVIVHVGDSRVYRIRRDAEQLTTDHTVVQREMDAGRMTKEEAAHSRQRNVLTQCIGASSRPICPEIILGTIEPGDVFLLCSDGFRHKISERELADELTVTRLQNRDTIYTILEDIISLVIQRGEKDNISAIVIKVD